MKKLTFCLMAFALLLSSCIDRDIIDDILNGTHGNNNKTDYFAVANRADGTITIYDADTQEKHKTITMHHEGAEPSYVVYSRKRDLLYVADFANEKIIAYSTDDFSVSDEFDAGAGAFHMWLNDRTDQLWVNNIVDKTTSVINLKNGNTLNTLALPDNIDFAEDAAQHDVTISPNGAFAYVSVFSKTGANYVLQYNTSNLKLKKYAEVGGDPHLVASQRHLYVLSQEDSSITEHKFANLQATGNTGSLDNVHGVTLGKNNNLFLTDLTGRKVASYNIASQNVNSITDAAAADGVAHNVAYNKDKKILALTRTAGSTVDFFKAEDGDIMYLSSDTSGANPFGIVYIDR